MKQLICILISFISLNALAAELQVPLFIEQDNNVVAASEINEQLKAIGAELLPDVIAYRTDKVQKTANAVDAKIAQAAKALNTDLYRQRELTPGEHNTRELRTCYKGSAADVVALAEQMTDTVYSDQLSLFGYRYKNEIVYVYDDSEQTQDFLRSESKAWREFTGKGSVILILASVGDGGDDVQESFITECK